MNSLLDRLIGFGWRKLSHYLAPVWLRSRGIDVALKGNVVLYGLPIINKSKNTSISIGANSVLCSRSAYTALGVSKPIIIRAMSSGANIVIGSDVGLSGTTICADQEITIGDNCMIGADVMICDTDFHSADPIGRRYGTANVSCSPVSIEANVFIGARTVVLKGVTIGRNSVIGAGSVVTSSIPENSIAAGNPCRVLRVQAPR
jgi:acetyltransferase-like isoleucine patch superfamily enzyme